jgi:protein-L-isoaspartate(D-aspartate) O-methyltransferase
MIRQGSSHEAKSLLVLYMIITAISSCYTRSPSPGSDQAEEKQFEQRRVSMVREQIEGEGVSDTAVLQAMRRVPRHRFVPAGLRDQAYADRPLPIGYDQTISQPYIVGLMTELLGLKKGHRVLEVGTGSGYQAAVLAEIVDSVWSIEIIEPLATSATKLLQELGYGRVDVRWGDGYLGWPEHAPFDGIIVTAAAEQIPEPLLQQLKDGGRMVIPVGAAFSIQNLVLVEKRDGWIRKQNVASVRFVPLVRERDR